MDYIDEIRENFKRETEDGNVRGLIDEKMFDLEDEIIAMNIAQIEDHTGSDGKRLKNENEKFTGVYTQMTEDLSKIAPIPLAPKVAGNPYNFLNQGDFLLNFHMKPEAEGYSIYSTGTGAGDKKAFFDGYKNMFGLIEGDKDIIFAEVEAYVLSKQLEKIYE